MHILHYFEKPNWETGIKDHSTYYDEPVQNIIVFAFEFMSMAFIGCSTAK